jgi:hypothetical protein
MTLVCGLILGGVEGPRRVADRGAVLGRSTGWVGLGEARYHHLFAEYLCGRLGSDSPERVGELHLNASASNGGRGQRDCRARRWYHRAPLLDALPTEAKRRRPRLLAEHALALVLTGRPNDLGAAILRAGVLPLPWGRCRWR